MKKEPKVLFYDIETSLLKAHIFSLGDQIVRHNQLVEGHSRPGIICLSYAFNNGPVKVLDYGYNAQNSAKVLEEFIPIMLKADIIIGKNNFRFDDKHLKTHMMWNNMEGHPELFHKMDDLESHMRRHFYLPSQSLDYISNELGLGGKEKMEFSDWVHIKEKTKDLGLKAFKKMIKYNKKDVEDTRSVWNYCKKHFIPKMNYSALSGKICCRVCGSSNIKSNGSRIQGSTKYQIFRCLDHKGYAGQHPFTQLKPKVLK